MSGKSNAGNIEILDLGQRRLYIKTSTGFVIHNDDLTPEELLVIAKDIALRDKERRADSQSPRIVGTGRCSPV